MKLFKNTRKQEIWEEDKLLLDKKNIQDFITREGKRLWLYNNIHKMELFENTWFKQEIREEKGYYYTMG